MKDVGGGQGTFRKELLSFLRIYRPLSYTLHAAMDVNVSYSPFSLVNEDELQFLFLSLRSEDITNVYSIDANLRVGMDTLMDADASSEERCMMMMFVEDSDEVAVAFSNPIRYIVQWNPSQRTLLKYGHLSLSQVFFLNINLPLK